MDHPISFVEDDAFLVIPQKDKFKDFSLKMEVKTMVRISVKLKIHNFIKFTLGQRRSDILQPWDLQTGLSITRSIKLQSDTYYKVE